MEEKTSMIGKFVLNLFDFSVKLVFPWVCVHVHARFHSLDTKQMNVISLIFQNSAIILYLVVQ